MAVARPKVGDVGNFAGRLHVVTGARGRLLISIADITTRKDVYPRIRVDTEKFGVIYPKGHIPKDLTNIIKDALENKP